MNNSKTLYKERLWATPWLYVITLLLVPAVALMLMPLNRTLGLVLAPLVYAIVAVLLTVSAPRVTVTEKEFTAGYANIPVTYLGNITVLNRDERQVAIGPGADARAFMLLRSWIPTSLKIENTDPTDSAPYWLISTRKPEELQNCLTSAAANAVKPR